LRILLTSHYGLPHMGGIETVIDSLARELTRRGHSVTHLASDARRPGEQAAPAEPAPYRVLRVAALNGLERRVDVPYPVFSPRLVPLLRRETNAADVVHAHGFLYMPTPLALGFARHAGRVLTEHVGTVGWSNPALELAERAAVASLGRASARLAQALVALNGKVEAELRKLAPKRPVERIVNGVDSELFRPPAPGERERLRAELGWDERPRALFVGRLVQKKGVDLAVAAARRAGVELVLVGPGAAPAGAAAGGVAGGGAAGSAPGVVALGPLPPARVRELYRAADAFLLPSRGEGFPLTAQEALASGLPVVLCDDPSYGDYVAGAGPGARLAAAHEEALAAALGELLNGDLEAARRSAREHALGAFSWERAAREHERLYERVLQR
jgi:glycosyltransferase involved in cell wall biosynthesis